MIEFRVGMQPGNNYRVAAALVGDEGDFASLQVANPGASFYVPSGDGQISFGGIGALSPMLTVWRKLHLEFDAMEQGPELGEEGRIVSGNVTGVALNTPASGQMTVTVSAALPGETNRFQRGLFTVPAGIFRVLSSTTNTVVVQGTASSGVNGETFVMADDDEAYLTEANMPWALEEPPDGNAIVAGIAPAYASAYILPVNANAIANLNPLRILPFYRNFIASDAATKLYYYYGVEEGVTGNRSLDDSPEFWASSLIFAFEPPTEQDGDPQTEPITRGAPPAYGIPLTSTGLTVVYMESIREWAASETRLDTLETGWPSETSVNFRQRLRDYFFPRMLYTVIAHELAHVPSHQGIEADHAEDGIMDDKKRIEDGFSSTTVRRLREASSW